MSDERILSTTSGHHFIDCAHYSSAILGADEVGGLYSSLAAQVRADMDIGFVGERMPVAPLRHGPILGVAVQLVGDDLSHFDPIVPYRLPPAHK